MIRYWETKQFWRKIVKPTPSLIHNVFWYPKPFETQKSSSTKWFGTVRQNNFNGKWWFPPPPLSLTTFDTRNFLKHRGVPLRNDSVLWDKKLSDKAWYSALRHKNFRYLKLWNTEESSTKWFGIETKQFQRKIVKPTSCLIPNSFRYPKPFETQKGSSTKWFGTVRQNNFNGKPWFPPPPLSLTIFDTRNFLKHRGVPLRNDSVLWDKKLSKKSWYSAPRHKNIRYLKLSETQKNPQRNDSVLRQNNFNAKSWNPPPLLSLTFFDTRNFLKRRRVPPRNDSVLWDKTISTENRDSRPLLYP